MNIQNEINISKYEKWKKQKNEIYKKIKTNDTYLHTVGWGWLVREIQLPWMYTTLHLIYNEHLSSQWTAWLRDIASLDEDWYVYIVILISQKDKTHILSHPKRDITGMTYRNNLWSCQSSKTQTYTKYRRKEQKP